MEDRQRRRALRRPATSSCSLAARRVHPTCSSTHLPRYNALVRVFREHGIDQVICIAVSDPVMEDGGKGRECGDVLLLRRQWRAFTEAMGMLVDKADLNFGKRSWRYSMLVRDRRIEKMFIEPQKEGDPFEVSDADTMPRLPRSAGEEAAAGRDPVARGAARIAPGRSELRDAGYDYADIDLPVAVRKNSWARSPVPGRCHRCSSTVS